MFKKQKSLPPPACVKYEELISNYLDASYRLSQIVEKVISKRDVITLYPEGADRRCAQKEYEEAQHQLLCAIGNFDGRRRDLQFYYEMDANTETLQEYHYKHHNYFQTSHAVIEETTRRYYNHKGV